MKAYQFREKYKRKAKTLLKRLNKHNFCQKRFLHAVNLDPKGVNLWASGSTFPTEESRGKLDTVLEYLSERGFTDA